MNFFTYMLYTTLLFCHGISPNENALAAGVLMSIPRATAQDLSITSVPP